jgi:hypothetical protein
VLENRFGVLYLGDALKVCFLEAVLRDRRNGVVGDYVIGESELRSRRYARIEPISPLHLIDLRAVGCVRMGIPSDVPCPTIIARFLPAPLTAGWHHLLVATERGDLCGDLQPCRREAEQSRQYESDRCAGIRRSSR